METKTYEELCNAYEALTLIEFSLIREGIVEGIEARDLIGRIIADEVIRRNEKNIFPVM